MTNNSPRGPMETRVPTEDTLLQVGRDVIESLTQAGYRLVDVNPPGGIAPDVPGDRFPDELDRGRPVTIHGARITAVRHSGGPFANYDVTLDLSEARFTQD